MSGQPRLKGRIVLVTGASRGLGAATAQACAAEGAQLILCARTIGGLEEVARSITQAGGLPPVLVPMDLLDTHAINQLGAAVFRQFGRLDVLIANAATLGVLGPLAQSDAQAFERTLALNLTANYHLIRSLDPLLRASAAGVALFVSSGAALRPAAHWGAYSISKLALEQMARIYAAETAALGVRVQIVDPGVLQTRMRAEAFPGEDPATLPHPASVSETLIKLAMAESELGDQERVSLRSMTSMQ